MVGKSDSTSAEELRTTFLGMLAYDVLIALERREIDDNQTSRRDFIRALFAAIEGSIWQFREHVRSIADDLDELSPILAMAIAENSYSVGENGKLVEQQRYIPMLSMIRLVTNLAKKLSPDLDADFSGHGWTDLKRTIAIRNRITHPKSITDLNITSDDTKTAWSGLIWLLEHVALTLNVTIAAQVEYLDQFKSLLEKLKAGDPNALKAYHSTFSKVHD
jgi:hypothetical protein